MGQYYNLEVIDDLKELPDSGLSKDMRYKHYRKFVDGNHRLIGVYDRGVSKIIVDVTSEREFNEFEGQYSQGFFIKRSYYSVPLSRLK